MPAASVAALRATPASAAAPRRHPRRHPRPSPLWQNECDGFLNMDRTNKFNAAQMAAIVAANKQLTGGQR